LEDLYEYLEYQRAYCTMKKFGKLTSVTQSGTWSGGSVSAARSFVYADFERLCRRISGLSLRQSARCIKGGLDPGRRARLQVR
jgi:hypothetical protein